MFLSSGSGQVFNHSCQTKAANRASEVYLLSFNEPKQVCDPRSALLYAGYVTLHRTVFFFLTRARPMLRSLKGTLNVVSVGYAKKNVYEMATATKIIKIFSGFSENW